MNPWKIFLTVFLSLCMRLGAQPVPGALSIKAHSEGGGVQRVLRVGDYLYAAEGSSFVVYDTRQEIYKKTWSHRLAGPIADMHLFRGNIYLAAGLGGIQKWSIQNPILPIITGAYHPLNNSEACWAIDFAADTIFVAAEGRLLLLRETQGIGAGFEKIGEMAEQAETHHLVAGFHWKSWYLALVTGSPAQHVGLHLFDLAKGERVSFFQVESDHLPRLVIDRVEKRFLLLSDHAEKGMQLREFDLDQLPQLLAAKTTWDVASRLSDTRSYFGCSEDMVFASSEMRQPVDSLHTFLTIFPKGAAPEKTAWAFSISDLAFGEGSLHFASASVGIRSYAVPYQLGNPPIGQNRHTGSACLGADLKADFMLTADGDQGFRMHEIKDRQISPIKIYERIGKVDQVMFHSSGQYAVCWIQYGKGDSIAILDLKQGKVMGSLSGPFGARNVQRFEDKIACPRPDGGGFDVLDCSNPRNPRKLKSVVLSIEGIGMDNAGHLLVSTKHNFRVYDIKTGFEEIANFARYGEGFGAIAAHDGILFVATEKRGLIRFQLVEEGKKWMLREQFSWKMPHLAPEYLCADGKAVFLGYESFGIYALAWETLEQLAWLPGGPNYMGRSGMGLNGLRIVDGQLLASDYFGQAMLLDLK